jgi:aminopeptidase
MERLAELAVVVGANIQPGQLVRISADVVHTELVRAVADAAYPHGASFVEADLSDLLLLRSQVMYA